MNGFWDINAGNLATIVSVLAALWRVHKVNSEKIEKRHTENLVAMAKVAVNQEHNDECIDALKKSFNELQKEFNTYVRSQ